MSAGTREVYANVDASASALYLLPPVSRGLIGLNLIGVDAATSLKNLARGGAAGGSATGTPTFTAGYGSFKSGSAFLTLPYVDPPSFTMLVAAQVTDTTVDGAHTPALFSSVAASGFQGGAGINAGVSASGHPEASVVAGSMNYSNAGTRTQTTRSTTGTIDLTRFRLFASTYDEATLAYVLYDLTGTAVSPTTTPSGSIREAGINALRIGSHYGTLAGTCNVAMTSVHNVALTGDELRTLYPFYKKLLLDKRGVAV
jgi:hypothetical protein